MYPAWSRSRVWRVGGPNCLRGLLTPRRHLPLLPCNRLLFNIVRRKTTNDSPAPWGMCHPFQEFCIKEKEVNMKEKKDEWRRAMGTFTTRPKTVAPQVTVTEYSLCVGRAPKQPTPLSCVLATSTTLRGRYYLIRVSDEEMQKSHALSGRLRAENDLCSITAL